MGNPMMEMLGRSARRQNNPMALLAELKKFASGMTPQKAQQEIERLLSSGQMSQSQFQQLQEQAKQFAQFAQFLR